jgi:hypothetical protein
MSALVGVHAEAWGMPNHCQHVLVDGDLSAAYVPPVEEGARAGIRFKPMLAW